MSPILLKLFDRFQLKNKNSQNYIFTRSKILFICLNAKRLDRFFFKKIYIIDLIEI